MMGNIGTQLGRVVERERARKAAEERADAIRSQSIRDELTGLYNRRGFLEIARQQLRVAQREGRKALLFFVDLNGMKQINDELGHDEGIARWSTLRTCCARYSGSATWCRASVATSSWP